MKGTRRKLLPDLNFGKHSHNSTDRRYVDTYGTVATAKGDSPIVVKSIDTTPRASFASSNNGDGGEEDNDDMNSNILLGKSSIAGATFNLGNGIVGAGIVGLPYALAQGGFMFATFMLVLVAALTHYTVTLMVETGRTHGRFSYEELCEQAFGTPGFYSLSVFQFLNSFGAW